MRAKTGKNVFTTLKKCSIPCFCSERSNPAEKNLFPVAVITKAAAPEDSSTISRAAVKSPIKAGLKTFALLAPPANVKV